MMFGLKNLVNPTLMWRNSGKVQLHLTGTYIHIECTGVRSKGAAPPCLWKWPHSPVIALVIDTVTLFVSCFSCQNAPELISEHTHKKISWGLPRHTHQGHKMLLDGGDNLGVSGAMLVYTCRGSLHSVHTHQILVSLLLFWARPSENHRYSIYVKADVSFPLICT